MSKFFKNITTFFLIGISILLGLIILINDHVKRNADFSIDEDINYAVFGHSHPSCAYNDSLISNFKNMAYSAELYFFTYHKIKNVLEHNPQIKTIFLEFTNNYLAKDSEELIWHKKFLFREFRVFSTSLCFEENFILFINNFYEYLNCYSLTLRDYAIRIYEDDFQFGFHLGGHLHINKNLIDSLNNVSNKEIFEQTENQISEFNLEYLDKIIDYCNEHDRDIILIRSPQHPNYPVLTNEKIFQKLVNNRYKDVEFLDLKDFPIRDNEFYDFNHVNATGSKKISNFFNYIITNGYIDKLNRADLIKSKISELEFHELENIVNEILITANIK